jgi:hypothetical protein
MSPFIRQEDGTLVQDLKKFHAGINTVPSAFRLVPFVDLKIEHPWMHWLSLIEYTLFTRVYLHLGRIDEMASEMEPSLFEDTKPSLDFLILADRAEAVGGKLYMMGGAWEHIYTQDLTQPSLISIAVGILVPWEAANQQHKIRIVIEDSDGQEIGFTAEASFAVGRPPWASVGETQRVVIAIPTIGVTFMKLGVYVLRAEINGEHVKRIRFRVLNPQQVIGLVPPQNPPM